MKLFELDEKTRMPIASAEALAIDVFFKIWRRRLPIDGDSDGRLKIQNIKELGWIYYSCTYDSRYKLMSDKDRDLAIKKIIGLEPEWKPDTLLLEGLTTYSETQETESTKLAEVLSHTITNLTTYLDNTQKAIANLGVDAADDVEKFLKVLDKVPDLVDQIKAIREKLTREMEDRKKGKKGRNVNKFELI